MFRYALRRLLSLIPTLGLVITLVFFMIRLAPGGPFDAERAPPPEVLEALNAKYQLDAPVGRQYLDFLGDLVLRGDLGPSFKYAGRSVNEIIATSLPVSAALGLWAMLVALLIGIPLGIIGAVKQGTRADALSMAVAMVGISVPRFVAAPLLVLW
ncbi:MAG: ABC transporter, partial [Myxococcota bacterium]